MALDGIKVAHVSRGPGGGGFDPRGTFSSPLRVIILNALAMIVGIKKILEFTDLKKS
jgi:hypothetical protein